MENERFLSLDQVADLVGLSQRSIKVHVRKGTFPPPIPITLRTNVWREADIQQWMREQLAEAPLRRAEQIDRLSFVREQRA